MARSTLWLWLWRVWAGEGMASQRRWPTREADECGFCAMCWKWENCHQASSVLTLCFSVLAQACAEKGGLGTIMRAFAERQTVI